MVPLSSYENPFSGSRTVDAALPVSYLDRFVRRVCVVVPEYRGLRLRYPVGALLLGLLLCECAGRLSQRSKEEWLKEHWHWIKKLWVKAGGQAVKEKVVLCLLF